MFEVLDSQQSQQADVDIQQCSAPPECPFASSLRWEFWFLVPLVSWKPGNSGQVP